MAKRGGSDTAALLARARLHVASCPDWHDVNGLPANAIPGPPAADDRALVDQVACAGG